MKEIKEMHILSSSGSKLRFECEIDGKINLYVFNQDNFLEGSITSIDSADFLELLDFMQSVAITKLEKPF
jgi:hypothetical protein